MPDDDGWIRPAVQCDERENSLLNGPYPAKTLDGARWQWMEMYGGPLVLNRWLSGAVGLLVVVVLALVYLNVQTGARAANMKPLVIGIDAVGRPVRLNDDATSWSPTVYVQAIRYVLTQFVQMHFGRVRATIQRDYPQSLFFLDPQLANANMTTADSSRIIETFLQSASDEVEIHVKNVTFQELTTAPYRASVDFDQVTLAQGRQERKRETVVAQLTFTVLNSVPNAFVPVNPLGIQVTYLRVDQAF